MDTLMQQQTYDSTCISILLAIFTLLVTGQKCQARLFNITFIASKMFSHFNIYNHLFGQVMFLWQWLLQRRLIRSIRMVLGVRLKKVLIWTFWLQSNCFYSGNVSWHHQDIEVSVDISQYCFLLSFPKLWVHLWKLSSAITFLDHELETNYERCVMITTPSICLSVHYADPTFSWCPAH